MNIKSFRLSSFSFGDMSALAVVKASVLCAGIYGTFQHFVVAERFESQSVVYVESKTDKVVNGFMGLQVGDGGRDSFVLKEHILSMEMYQYINEQLDLVSHYEGAGMFSSLPQDAGYYEIEQYWRSMVTVEVDEAERLVRLGVQGYSAEMTHKIASLIIGRSEWFINELGKKEAMEDLVFAYENLADSKNELEVARHLEVKFQVDNKTVNPERSYEGELQGIADIQSQIKALELEIETIKAYQNEESIGVKAKQLELDALRGALAKYSDYLLESARDEGDVLVEYERLKMKGELAQEVYRASLVGYKTARLESTKKLKHMHIVLEPTKPTQAKYPEIFRGMLVCFVVCLMLIYIVKGFAKSVREGAEK